MANWHYIGSSGSLGPLTSEQMKDLVESGVIERPTMVWTAGMTDWKPASTVPSFQEFFSNIPPDLPPPPPNSQDVFPQPSGINPTPFMFQPVAKSPKNYAVAGVLNLFFPGFGRLYLGFTAIGLLQLLLLPFGIGIVWSFIDGVLIIFGKCRYDGNGRALIS